METPGFCAEAALAKSTRTYYSAHPSWLGQASQGLASPSQVEETDTDGEDYVDGGEEGLEDLGEEF